MGAARRTLLVAQRAGLSAAWGEPVALRRHVVDLAPVVGDDVYGQCAGGLRRRPGGPPMA
jgi:hypothetical protein